MTPSPEGEGRPSAFPFVPKMRAELALVEGVPKLTTITTQSRLKLRIGLATGLVVGDLVGTGEAQERGVVGETPNLVACLQAEAAPGTIVIGRTT